jgi:hypothetical protein
MLGRFLLFLMSISGVALAQTENSGGALDAAQDTGCAHWQEQLQANDPQLRQQLTGVWEWETTVPPNAVYNKPTTTRHVLNLGASGDFAQDDQTCVAPDGFEPACTSSQVYGQWATHVKHDNWMFLALLGRNAYGQADCSGSSLRFTDPNTLTTPQGGTARRVSAQ